MSRIRRAFVGVVCGVLGATAVGGVIDHGGGHRPPARPAALIRSAAPAAATAPTPASGGFDADAFLAVVEQLDPAVANALIATLSAADRAAIATDVATSTGLKSG